MMVNIVAVVKMNTIWLRVKKYQCKMLDYMKPLLTLPLYLANSKLGVRYAS